MYTACMYISDQRKSLLIVLGGGRQTHGGGRCGGEESLDESDEMCEK